MAATTAGTVIQRSSPGNIEQSDFGKAGDPKRIDRTIHIVMADNMCFVPADISANEGEVVKFVVSNRGKIMHEMVIGTRKELMEQAALMSMGHDEAYMFT